MFCGVFVSLSTIKESLSAITKTMNTVRANREYIIKNSRDVVILCSQSIIKVHAGDITDARARTTKAQSRLREIKKRMTPNLRSQIIVAEQELVEAMALIAIVEKKEIPTLKAMSVSGDAYVLGLLDCIGELKRRILDMIRIGNSDEAVRVFEIMNELYDLLYPFAAYDKVIRDARRKLDVNRELIERARFAVAEAASRTKLERIISDSR